MKGSVIARLLLITLLVVASGWMAKYHDQINIEVLKNFIGNPGLISALIFTLLFAVTTVLLVPGLFFTLAGGILFGPFIGTLLNLIGATLGAGISFLIARYVAADWVAEKSHVRVRRLIEGVEAEGWRFVAFLRLVPIVPFFLMNYVLGITRISFTAYLITTFVTLSPSVVAITYVGYAGREVVGDGESIVQKLLIALGLIGITIFLPLFFKKWFGKSYNETP